MSEQWSEAPAAAPDPSAAGLPSTAAPSTPTSLLEQMQELLASVNADLAGMGAALQSAGARTAGPTGSADPAGRSDAAPGR
ncbi:hypothetical protein [Kitasatospora sp. NPDC057015]|uniref:hypothetical protein n=1 Tax=Kitasatospora sp. NPDC057015 TaxID=3346001 RepID=UPI003644E0A3